VHAIPATHPGDLARRVSYRRIERGLSIEELATSAGISPVYLKYFEEHSDQNLSFGTLKIIAKALDTSPTALLGGDIDSPLGRGRPVGSAVLKALTEDQCQAHLAAGGIGRLVFLAPRGPIALPVNYAFTGSEVVFVTDVFKAMDLQAQAVVSLEIDRVVEDHSEGWSVMASGTPRRVVDPEEMRRFASLGLTPWAGGNRPAAMAIMVKKATGRVIVRTPDRGARDIWPIEEKSRQEDS
jgi:DNA-binding Xre family transcriptional regulator